MTEHERIWLQNADDPGNEGRLLVRGQGMADDPEDGEPTEYVRADLYEKALAENERLRVRLKEATDLMRELVETWDRVTKPKGSA